MKSVRLFMTKNILTAFLSVTLAIVFALTFASCQIINDSWNTPVKDYFKEYTENVAVATVKFDAEFPVDSEGYISVPAYTNRDVKFVLRNPQQYHLYIKMNFVNEDTEDDYERGQFPTIKQNEEDVSLLNMTITSAFLKNHDGGGDVSSLIYMTEPKSGRTFDAYKFALRCNTPPDMYGAIVCNLPVGDNVTNYVLCFNLPKTEFLKAGATHSDINCVVIDDKKFLLTIDEAGIITTDSEQLLTQRPEKMAAGVTGDFVATGTALYYLTCDALKEEDTVYNLGVRDNKGLNLFYKVSAKAAALNEVTFKDVDGNEIKAGSELQQDEGSSYCTIQIVPAPDVTFERNGVEVTENTEDSWIVYELYSVDENGTETLIEKARNLGVTKVQLSPGKNKIYAYAQKDYFADSKMKSTDAVVESIRLYVDETYDGTKPDGSEARPFRTLTDAYAKLSDVTNEANRIFVLSDLTGTSSEDIFTLNNTNACVAVVGAKEDGTVSSVTAASDTHALNVKAGKLTLQNMSMQYENSAAFDTGSIYVASGAELTLCGIVNADGGLYLEEGAVISLASGDDGDLKTFSSKSKINLRTQAVPKADSVVAFVDSWNFDFEPSQIFASLDNYVVLKKDGSAVLAVSGGGVEIVSYVVKFALDAQEYVQGGTINVKAEVYEDGQRFDLSEAEVSNWNISIIHSGVTVSVYDSSSISIPSDWPAGNYTLTVSCCYKTVPHSSLLEFVIKQKKE